MSVDTMGNPTANANELYPELVRRVLMSGKTIPSRNGETKELHPILSTYTDIRRRHLSTIGRVINLPFALVETIWILTGDDKLDRIGFYNSKIKDFSDDGVRFNAAYGYRMMGGVNQLQDVIWKFQKSIDTRHAVISYYDPYNDSILNETKDRACNLLSMFLIREGRLDMTQVIRSNDITLGLPYNIVQFTTIQEVIAEFLKVPVGNFQFLANSLHLYEQDYESAEHLIEFDIYKYFDSYIMKFPDHVGSDTKDLTLFLQDIADTERSIRHGLVNSTAYIQNLNLPYYWQEMLIVFLSYYKWKTYQKTDKYWLHNVMDITNHLDGVFYPLLVKNYYQWRIKKQDEETKSQFFQYIYDWLAKQKIFSPRTILRWIEDKETLNGK